MDDMAEAAGVTKPVLYQHFGSKRELYLEVLDDLGNRLLEAIGKAAAAAGGPRQQVENGFSADFRFVADNESACRVLFVGSGRDGDDREFVHAVRRAEAASAAAIPVLVDADI